MNNGPGEQQLYSLEFGGGCAGLVVATHQDYPSWHLLANPSDDSGRSCRHVPADRENPQVVWPIMRHLLLACRAEPPLGGDKDEDALDGELQERAGDG